MLYKFELPLNLTIKILKLKKKKFLLLNKNVTSSYIEIPKSIKCLKKQNFLFLNIKTKIRPQCVFLIKQTFKRFNRLLIRKLILKGLGLKVNFINNNILELKLGFSHLIKILINTKKISIFLKKNIIFIESFSSIYLGNFLYNIRKLRFPNAYKGKGVWYKNEIRILKPIKKA